MSRSPRFPAAVYEKAARVLQAYRDGSVSPSKLIHGYLSLRVGYQHRLLSRDSGNSWELLTHETYNTVKDRRL